MSVSLLTTKIWTTLAQEAKRARRPAHVAVAYFGNGAAALLPLPRGSRLVVDASEGAVKSGQTCPAELGKLIKRGVRVYSIQNLHAKVFVLGTKAYVGSANVSHNSAGTLVEAMVVTTDRKTLAAANEFVGGLCVQDIGPEEIKRLSAMYRPPRIPGGRRARRSATKREGNAELPAVRIANLVIRDYPEGSEDTYEVGKKVAAKRLERPRLHSLEDFFWPRKCAFRPGDVAVIVLDEGGGRRIVYPPGTVVHTRTWRRGERSTTFVYVETPTQRRVSLEKLAKRIGRGAKKRLTRSGQVKREFAEKLLEAWNR